MKNKKPTLSLRRRILLMFIISLFISVAGYGALIFTNWVSSARNTTAHIAADINEEIYNRIDTLIQGPYHTNEVNHKVIKNKMLDWSDENQRDRFFVGVLESHSNSTYSFSYGTANGEYYGARRNKDGVVEIMRNNAETGGNSWYYSVNEDLTAGDLIVQAGKFDPRTRAWYKAAVEAGGPVFSPLYKHFVMEDLTVSAAWPVYNETGNLDGVLGTHMLLSGIGSFLKDAVEEHNGMAIIIEKESNYLVANSMDAENFVVLQDGTLERYALDDLDNTNIQNVFEQYKSISTPQMIYQGENDSFFVNASEIHMNGIDWLVISAMTEYFQRMPYQTKTLRRCSSIQQWGIES